MEQGLAPRICVGLQSLESLARSNLVLGDHLTAVSAVRGQLALDLEPRAPSRRLTLGTLRRD